MGAEHFKQARLTIFGKEIVNVFIPPVADEDRSLSDAINVATGGITHLRKLETWFDGRDIVIVDGNLLKILTKPPLKLGEVRHIPFGVDETMIPVKYSALIDNNPRTGLMRVTTSKYKVYRK